MMHILYIRTEWKTQADKASSYIVLILLNMKLYITNKDVHKCAAKGLFSRHITFIGLVTQS